MEKINNEIKTAIKLSKKHKEVYSKYCNVYPWTNEELKGSFEPFCKEGTKVLTCNGSGDHVLNAILYGSSDVTTFDINKFSLYYLDLKIAAILSFSKEEFLNYMPGIFDEVEFILNVYDRGLEKRVFLNNTLDKAIPKLREMQKEKEKNRQDLFTSQKFLENLKNVSEESYQFWTGLYNKDKSIMDSFLFKTHSCGSIDDIIVCSNYLTSDEKYNAVKNSLLHTNIKKEHADIEKLPRVLQNEQYDFIHLSNIATVFYQTFLPYKMGVEEGIKAYSQFVGENIYPLLKEDGTMILNVLQDPYIGITSARIDCATLREFHEVNMNLEILDLQSKARVYYKKR